MPFSGKTADLPIFELEVDSKLRVTDPFEFRGQQKRTFWREPQKHTPDIITLGRPPPYVVHYTQRFDAVTSSLRCQSLRGLLFYVFFCFHVQI